MSEGSSERDPEGAAPKRLHLVVDGRVQGVGFRRFVQRKARALGLTGWVRNLPGGEVEALAEGPEPALAELLRHVRRGPPGSWVDSVAPRWLTATGEFTRFEVTYY